jgi:hypothetical protein
MLHLQPPFIVHIVSASKVPSFALFELVEFVIW